MRIHAIFCSLACAVVILTSNASAQGVGTPPAGTSAFDVQGVTGTVPMNPEMWLYLHQEQRLEDPQQIVRLKAQEKAAARRNRIAAMRWFGYSAARPKANPTPWTSQYSPAWVGNGPSPLQWQGNGGFQVAQPGNSAILR